MAHVVDIGLAEGRGVITGLSVDIARVISESKSGMTTRFDCVYPPEVSVRDYLARLYDHMRCSPECYVLSMIYMNRFVEMNPDLALSATNIHRLLLTTVVIAAKFFDDSYCANKYYARIGGLTTKELNSLESNFLEMVCWKVYVSQEECLECAQRWRSSQGVAEPANCEFTLNSARGQGSTCDPSVTERAHAEETATATVSGFNSLNSMDAQEAMDVTEEAPVERSTPKTTVQSGRLTKRSPVKPSRRCRVKTMSKECALTFFARQKSFGDGLGSLVKCSKQHLDVIVVT